jgi:hypothetical protein
MNLVLALALNAIMGGCCAWRARAWLESRREWAGLPLLVALGATAFSVPALTWLFRFYSAWFVHFMANPVEDLGFDTASFGLSAALMLILMGTTAAGFLAVRWAFARMHPPYCLFPIAMAVALAAGFLALHWETTLYVGDLAALESGTLMPLWTHTAGAMSLVPVLTGMVAIRKCGQWFGQERRSQPPVSA